MAGKMLLLWSHRNPPLAYTAKDIWLCFAKQRGKYGYIKNIQLHNVTFSANPVLTRLYPLSHILFLGYNFYPKTTL